MPQSLVLALRTAYSGQVVLLAVIYYLTAKISLLLAIPPGYATAVWPPSGVALAAMLMFGSRIWPGIWIGAALVNFTIHSSLFAAVVIASGNTLEALTCAALIRRFVGVPYHFARGEDVIIFVALAHACAAIAATIGLVPVMVADTTQATDHFDNWWTWWLGDASGIVIFVPFILGWNARVGALWSRQKKVEGVCLALLLFITLWIVFSGEINLPPFPRTHLMWPFVIWAAFRFGQRETATVIAAICTIAVWYTLGGSGPFSTGSLNASLLLLLTYANILAAIGLVICAVVDERSRAMHQLRIGRDELESVVRERTCELERVNQALHEDVAARTLIAKQLQASEQRLRESQAQLRALATHLQSVREEQQINIAREIHDGMGQALTGLKMDLAWLANRLQGDQKPLLDKAHAMSGLIDDIIHSVRKIASGLRPDVLDEFGLASAVGWQAREFQLRTGIRCKVDLPTDMPEIGQAHATAVFRIFQELLTNVARHANATRVDVSLRLDRSTLILEVHDNGRGITDSDVRGPRSLGLLGMHERVLPFNGKVQITGSSGKGTKASVSIPLHMS